ncbi:MAG: hydroxyacylglutathione hydrolase [Asticcacaulis sp.]
MALKIDVFPALHDNYGFILKDEASGLIASIDAPEPRAILARLAALGETRLDFILNTHWHPDHAGGNALLKKRLGCVIYGPQEVTRIAPLDQLLKAGDLFQLGETALQVIDLTGHTLGHVGYYDAVGGHAFVGDTLFPLGCGRLFEGTPEDMWGSLLRLSALPDDTILYSAHEYTLANLAFAESLSGEVADIDAALTIRAERVRAMRERGEATVPSILAHEKTTNPYLAYPLREATFTAQAAKFGALRKAKDRF